MAPTYASASEFDGKSASAIDGLMHDAESFELAIPTWMPLWRRLLMARWHKKRFRTKLVLTDERLIVFERGWIRERSDDFLLDDIASVEFTKGWRKATLHIEGPSFEESFAVNKDAGQEFASAVRGQRSD